MAEERDFSPKPEGVEAIDWLRPGTEQHSFVLGQLRERLNYSERKMSAFYSRWRANELQLQAYIKLNDYDQLLKNMEADGRAPSPVEINVPFTWATINTIVTYLLHMFGGRKPIFQVSSYRAEQVDRAKNMEMFLQYNSDVVRFLRALYFFLMDGETYGVAIIRNMWKTESRSRWIQMPPSPELIQLTSSFGMPPPKPERQRQSYISFEGNDVSNIDPFMFFPDPRCPMHEVNTKGEFVFWRAFEGKHTLLKEQAAGRLKNVDRIDWTASPVSNEGYVTGESARGVRALGTSSPGGGYDTASSRITPNCQLDQGTIQLVPKDWGLGDSNVPETWLFTIANKNTILQAEPIELPHGRHPIVVAEPNSVGYAFGQLGTVDMLGPLQSQMSWFLNSHIYNVRAALNNMLVVDPTKVEMQDLKNPSPGGVIRLKNTAFGLSDPKSAISQLAVTDITRSHLADFQLFGKLAADLTGASDNVRGNQDSGGRKTATEVRTSTDAGTSRLAAKGTLYSAMAVTDLAEQQALNAQAFLTQEFELQVLGQASQGATLRITPDSLAGDFFFPVHDGTLPVDKLGMMEVWKEIFVAAATQPSLQGQYDLPAIFDWVCQLGGAQNIKSFKINVVSNEQQQQDLASGNGVPLGAATPPQMIGA